MIQMVRLITMVFRICSTSTAQMVVAKDLGLAVISYVGATLLGICRIGTVCPQRSSLEKIVMAHQRRMMQKAFLLEVSPLLMAHQSPPILVNLAARCVMPLLPISPILC